MKKVNFIYIALTLLVSILSNSLYAQTMSRAEERQLLEELKALQKDPYRLLQMKKQNENLANEILQKEKFFSLQNANREALIDELGKKDSVTFYLRDQVIKMENRNLTSGSIGDTTSLINRPSLANTKAFFRVQIGAYRNKRLAKNLNTKYKFITEVGGNGLKKYLIGDFPSYEEAKKLTQYLARKGAQAFVVGYLDNKRLSSLRQMPKEYF